MENERIRPIIDFAGIKFYADAYQMNFVQVGHPENLIKYSELMNFDDHSEFMFDKYTQTARRGKLQPEADRHEYIWLRPLSALDPQGMELLIRDQKYIWPELYRTPLPVVDFAGTDFYIDELRGGYREVGNRWNFIDYRAGNNKDGYYYNLQEKNVAFGWQVNPFDPPNTLPEGIVLVHTPTRAHQLKMLRNVRTRTGEKLPRVVQFEMLTQPKRGKSI